MNGTNAEVTGALLDPKAAHAAMADLLDYYVKFHKVVKQKLAYARTALDERLRELSDAKTGPSPDTMKRYEKLGRHLQKLAALFGTADLSIGEMKQIENTLEIMPPRVLARYQALVGLDERLMALIQDITSDEYRRAYERARDLTESIQKNANPMSGLPPSEYDTGIRRPNILGEQKKMQALRRKDPAFAVLPNGEKVSILH